MFEIYCKAKQRVFFLNMMYFHIKYRTKTIMLAINVNSQPYSHPPGAVPTAANTKPEGVPNRRRVD